MTRYQSKMGRRTHLFHLRNKKRVIAYSGISDQLLKVALLIPSSKIILKRSTKINHKKYIEQSAIFDQQKYKGKQTYNFGKLNTRTYPFRKTISYIQLRSI